MYTGAIIMTLVFSYLFMEYGIHLRYRIDDLVLRCCVVVFIESYNNAVFNAVGKTTKRYIFFLFMLQKPSNTVRQLASKKSSHSYFKGV